MENTTKKENQLSRRSMLPILGSSLLLPFFGFGKSLPTKITTKEDDEFHTLLKPDGTAVKVSVSALKKAKVVTKNVSNKSLLNWLGKKL